MKVVRDEKEAAILWQDDSGNEERCALLKPKIGPPRDDVLHFRKRVRLPCVGYSF